MTPPFSRSALAALLLVGTAMLAGCQETPETTQQIRGGFTHGRTNADLSDFDATVRAHGVEDYALLESFPEQFIVEVDAPTCPGLLEALRAKAYLDGVRGC